MFKNRCTYFDHKATSEEMKYLLTSYESSNIINDKKEKKAIYQKIVDRMYARVNDHYIVPMERLIKESKDTEYMEDYGFILMGVNCILIEFYYEMVKGYDTSKEGGKVQDAYTYVLNKLLGVDKDLSQIFYKGIRCGIIHQGQTKEETAITVEEGFNVIISQIGKLFLCNPITLFVKLTGLYDIYWNDARNSKVTDPLAINLVRKCNMIIKEIPKTL